MPENRPGTKLLTVKLYPEERERLAANAKQAGLSMSAFIRWRCVEGGDTPDPIEVEALEDDDVLVPDMLVAAAPPAVARARILRW